MVHAQDYWTGPTLDGEVFFFTNGGSDAATVEVYNVTGLVYSQTIPSGEQSVYEYERPFKEGKHSEGLHVVTGSIYVSVLQTSYATAMKTQGAESLRQVAQGDVEFFINAEQGGYNVESAVVVVATADDTRIEIVHGPANAQPAQTTENVELDRFETYSMTVQEDVVPTHITSSQPVAVLAAGVYDKDPWMNQLASTSFEGTQFVVCEPPGRSNYLGGGTAGHVVFSLLGPGPAIVTWEGADDGGQTVLTSANPTSLESVFSSIYVESTAPILVSYMGRPLGPLHGLTGFYVAPIDMWQTGYSWGTPDGLVLARGFVYNTTVASGPASSGTQLQAGGEPVSPGSPYYCSHSEIRPGVHGFAANQPVQVTVSGQNEWSAISFQPRTPCVPASHFPLPTLSIVAGTKIELELVEPAWAACEVEDELRYRINAGPWMVLDWPHGQERMFVPFDEPCFIFEAYVMRMPDVAKSNRVAQDIQSDDCPPVTSGEGDSGNNGGGSTGHGSGGAGGTPAPSKDEPRRQTYLDHDGSGELDEDDPCEEDWLGENCQPDHVPTEGKEVVCPDSECGMAARQFNSESSPSSEQVVLEMHESEPGKDWGQGDFLVVGLFLGTLVAFAIAAVYRRNRA